MRTSSLEADDLGLALMRPTEAIHMAYLAMIADFEAAGEQHLIRERHRIAVRDFDEFLRYCEADVYGLPGLVPQTLFLVVRHRADIVGECPIRHHLTPALEDVGGHIGYQIAPSARRHGYATRALALALPEARTLGLERVLLTCNADNLPSVRVIERNGGTLASESFSTITGTLVRRYWIETSLPNEET
jgi:predicted acetyltransferase